MTKEYFFSFGLSAGFSAGLSVLGGFAGSSALATTTQAPRARSRTVRQRRRGPAPAVFARMAAPCAVTDGSVYPDRQGRNGVPQALIVHPEAVVWDRLPTLVPLASI